MKRTNRKRPERPTEFNMDTKLLLLTQPLSIDLNLNETNKYLEEIRTNGGYESLKTKLGKKTFTKHYSTQEIQIMNENLENLKPYLGDNISLSDQSDISVEDLRARAVVLNEESLADIGNVPLDETFDSGNEFMEPFSSTLSNNVNGTFRLIKTNDIQFISASQIYHDEANTIYNDFKQSVIVKMNQIKNPCDTTFNQSFKAIDDHVNQIMNLQSEYIKNEKNRNELVHKLREIVVKQDDTCEEMLK